MQDMSTRVTRTDLLVNVAAAAAVNATKTDRADISIVIIIIIRLVVLIVPVAMALQMGCHGKAAEMFPHVGFLPLTR